jgi:predicted  nucleic acid-binding Zn-ribbon protein
MKRELETLVALQENDKRIRALQDQLQRLLQQRQQLQATLEAETEELQAEKRKLADLERLSREQNAAVDDLDAQLRKYQKQLDDGLLSFKEMEAYREKVQHGRQRIEQLEEEAISLMEKLAQEAERAAQREASFAQWRSRMDEEIAEVDRELERQRRKLEEGEAQRQTLAQHMDPALLERYERLHAEYEDPVASVRDGRCTSCNLQLSEITLERVREGHDLVTCENCLRILHS